LSRRTLFDGHHTTHADTTIVNIYAELVVRWLYGFPCTMVTVGPQEC